MDYSRVLLQAEKTYYEYDHNNQRYLKYTTLRVYHPDPCELDGLSGGGAPMAEGLEPGGESQLDSCGAYYSTDTIAEDKYIDRYFEKDISNNTKDHIYLGTTKLATVNNASTPYFVISDHLSSNSIVTDNNGSIIETSDYEPYGKLFYSNEVQDTGNEYKFTGKEYDDENSLQYFGARYLDNNTARLYSIDPWNGDLTDPQTLNKYAYALNNPLRYNDPSGQTSQDAVWGYFVGRVQTFVNNLTNMAKSTAAWANNPVASSVQIVSNTSQTAEDTARQAYGFNQAFYSDPSGAFNDTITGLQMEYDEFASQSDYEQGRDIGVMTENIAEAVVLGKATQSVLSSSYLSTTGQVPGKAFNVLKQIENNKFQSASQGYKGGGIWKNDPVNGKTLLPEKRAGYYKEWDVSPKVQGAKRGPERIITGQGGEAWYTPDHYETFTRIK